MPLSLLRLSFFSFSLIFSLIIVLKILYSFSIKEKERNCWVLKRQIDFQ